jgi:hypothetical protein
VEMEEEKMTAMLKGALKSQFAILEWINGNPVNFQYRVIGNIGIAWDYQTSRVKPKDGPVRTTQIRVSQTWIKSDGKWRMLMGHHSKIPSGESSF